jgi:hypothetical protein
MGIFYATAMPYVWRFHRSTSWPFAKKICLGCFVLFECQWQAVRNVHDRVWWPRLASTLASRASTARVLQNFHQRGQHLDATTSTREGGQTLPDFSSRRRTNVCTVFS